MSKWERLKHNHKGNNDRHNHNHKKLIDHFLIIMIMSLVMIMSSLRFLFPLDHKNLIFMVMIMMFIIVMSLVGNQALRKHCTVALLKITSTAISTDHTFKVSKNIGFARKVDGKFVKQFENCFIVLGEAGEIMAWRLTTSTAFAEIEDLLLNLKQRLDKANVQLTHVYVDDCCRVRKKY